MLLNCYFSRENLLAKRIYIHIEHEEREKKKEGQESRGREEEFKEHHPAKDGERYNHLA